MALVSVAVPYTLALNTPGKKIKSIHVNLKTMKTRNELNVSIEAALIIRERERRELTSNYVAEMRKSNDVRQSTVMRKLRFPSTFDTFRSFAILSLIAGERKKQLNHRLKKMNGKGETVSKGALCWWRHDLLGFRALFSLKTAFTKCFFDKHYFYQVVRIIFPCTILFNIF